MAYNFSLQDVGECLPLSRKELLSDVLVARLYGDITNVWHQPGHVFISTDNGRKLFTFDCNPIHTQNGFSNASLDISNSPSSIVDVILISPSLAVVVERNGHTQWWRYMADCDWVHIGNMELCSLVQSYIVTISFLTTSSRLVWCEGKEKHRVEPPDSSQPSSGKPHATFCIKSKSVSISDLSSQMLREHEVLPNVTLVENCPACDVLALAGGDKLFIRTKAERDQITVSLVCSPDISRVSLYIGQETFDTTVSTAVLDFRGLLLKHLPTIIKMEMNYGDLGMRKDTDRVVSLSSCGLLEVFTFTDGVDKSKTGHRVLPLTLEDPSSLHTDGWFLHRKFLGILSQHTLRLYSIQDGACLSTWTSDDLTSVSRVIPSCSSVLLAWSVCPHGLRAIKATDPKVKTAYTSLSNLPDDELLETAVLQLTHLHQMRQSGYDQKVWNKLEKLRRVWSEGRGCHQSQIVDMIAPLMDEYWSLEDASILVMDKQGEAHPPANTCPDEMAARRFNDEMAKTSGLPRRAKESRLLWLAQTYPHLLLDTLTQGITLDCENVLEEELARWQSLLGVEGWDLARFELVCRLLYQHHPHKLCHFVQCAQWVSEHTVGVSAFVRKKHSLIFYRSALDCLPLAETSCDPKVAAGAHGKLILASGGENYVEKALKHLLGHGLWEEAVDLIKGQGSVDRDRLASYLYMTVTAMAQNESLSKFVPEILNLMPTWKSFLSMSHVTSRQPSIRRRQLSTSASDLFCRHDDPDDVSIGEVKPQLMELIKKMAAKF